MQFIGLWKKEMAMMRGFHIITALLLLAVILWVIFNTMTDTDIESIVGLASISLIIMPATIIFSLNMEVHEMNMFLYRKNSIKKIIHIKFLHGFVNALIYFILTLLLAFTLQLFNRVNFELGEFFHGFAFNMLDFGIISIIASVMLYAAWVMHQWLKHKIGFAFSMLIIISLIYLSNYFIPVIGDFLTFFSDLWKVKYEMHIGSNQQVIEENFISISYIIAVIVLLSFLYFLITWLLKKKVEV